MIDQRPKNDTSNKKKLLFDKMKDILEDIKTPVAAPALIKNASAISVSIAKKSSI